MKRTSRFAIRLNDEEREALDREAERMGLSRGATIRRLVIRAHIVHTRKSA